MMFRLVAGTLCKNDVSHDVIGSDLKKVFVLWVPFYFLKEMMSTMISFLLISYLMNNQITKLICVHL